MKSVDCPLRRCPRLPSALSTIKSRSVTTTKLMTTKSFEIQLDWIRVVVVTVIKTTRHTSGLSVDVTFTLIFTKRRLFKDTHGSHLHSLPFPPLSPFPSFLLVVDPLYSSRRSVVSSPGGVWGGSQAEINVGTLHFSLKIWHLLAIILMTFPRINYPKCHQWFLNDTQFNWRCTD